MLSAAESRAAVAAAAAPPSWVEHATKAPLEVDADEATRIRNGYTHFASEARFEHTMTEWEEERDESVRSVRTEMTQWHINGRNTLSDLERDHLLRSHAAHLEANSAFDAAERAEQRAKVEKNLTVRVAAVYKPPPEAWLRAYVAPRPDLPLDLEKTSKPLPPAAGAPGAVVSIPPSPPEYDASGGPPALPPFTVELPPSQGDALTAPEAAISPELGSRGDGGRFGAIVEEDLP